MSNPRLKRHARSLIDVPRYSVGGDWSPEMLELAKRGVERMTANTAGVQGAPCPCGGGPADFVGQLGRFWCAKCRDGSLAAGLAFVMDESFGGP